MQLLRALCSNRLVVVGGCGTRSVFYFGFFEYLQKKPGWEAFLAQVRGAAGTSSGSIVALALLIGGDFKALYDAIAVLSQKHKSIAPMLSMTLMLSSYGLDDGRVVEQVIETCLETLGLAPSTTFAGLRRLTGKDFRVCATNMRTLEPVIFSAQTSPHLALKDAIRMSMTVPFIYAPMRYMGDPYADGALLANVPVDAFGADETPVAIFTAMLPTVDPTSLKGYASAVICSTLNVQRQLLEQWGQLHPDHYHLLEDGGEEGLDGADAATATSALPSFLNTGSSRMAMLRRRGLVQAMLLHDREPLIRLLALLVIADVGGALAAPPTPAEE